MWRRWRDCWRKGGGRRKGNMPIFVQPSGLISKAFRSASFKNRELGEACLRGKMEKEEEEFDAVVRWTSAISALVHGGRLGCAFALFRRIQVDVAPDRVTFLTLLGACVDESFRAEGKMLHACLTYVPGFDSDVVSHTALLTMYSKCFGLENSTRIFRRLRPKTVISWTAMVGAYARCGHPNDAFDLFRKTLSLGFAPDRVLTLTILSTCLGFSSISRGKFIHAHSVDKSLVSDPHVKSALVSMYGKCLSREESARRILESIPERKVGSWNSMISGSKDALRIFHLMQEEGVTPNRITFASILTSIAKSLTTTFNINDGKLTHIHTVDACLDSDTSICNSLINMYAKCRRLQEAFGLFVRVNTRDIITWNTMIVAFYYCSEGERGIELYRRMSTEGIRPDKFTFTIVLNLLGHVGMGRAEGRIAHAFIIERGLDSNDDAICRALVTMYGECGELDCALGLFNGLPKRDLLSWTSLIAAHAQHGQGERVLSLFQQMQEEGVKPDGITFVSVLSACSHSGLVEDGCSYFTQLSDVYGIAAQAEHYNCMIDLLGRSGQLDSAEAFIRKMPRQGDAIAWMTFLYACRGQGDLERAKLAAEQVFKLDPMNSAPYMILSDMYSASGRWEDAMKLRNEMGKKLIEVSPEGCEERAWEKSRLK